MLGFVNFKEVVGGAGSGYKTYTRIIDIVSKVLAVLLWIRIGFAILMICTAFFSAELDAIWSQVNSIVIALVELIIIHVVVYIVAVNLAKQVNREDEKRKEIVVKEIWFCSHCGTRNEGKFCVGCGASKAEVTRLVRPTAPTAGVWVCRNCGEQNSQKFSQCKKCACLIDGTRVEVRMATENIPEELAPDEWECAFCGNINKSNFCVECGISKLKTEEAHGKIWFCKNCNTPNDASRGQCKNCAALRNGTSIGAWEQLTEDSISYTWKCANCGTRNANRHEQCQKCAQYRV